MEARALTGCTPGAGGGVRREPDSRIARCRPFNIEANLFSAIRGGQKTEMFHGYIATVLVSCPNLAIMLKLTIQPTPSCGK